MSVTTAGDISANLLAAGRDPKTPVAVVENGSLPNERVATGTLNGLPDLVRGMGVSGPAVLFVGETAAWAQADVAIAREHAA